MPFYSIVIPAYNVGPYISECVTSVLDQDDRDFEILVVDDASTDETPRLLAQLAAKDPRVHVITQQANSGRHLARLIGLENARGRWMLFLDGDDQLHEGGLSALRTQLEGEDADLVRFGMSVVPKGSVSHAQARQMEASYNTGEGELSGSAITQATYDDMPGNQSRVLWSVVNLAVSSRLAMAAARLMTRRRLDRLEDAYENFVLSALARKERFATGTIVYDYHWGRGVTGSSRLSPREQERHCRQIAAVAEAMRPAPCRCAGILCVRHGAGAHAGLVGEAARQVSLPR